MSQFPSVNGKQTSLYLVLVDGKGRNTHPDYILPKDEKYFKLVSPFFLLFVFAFDVSMHYRRRKFRKDA